MPRSDKFSLSVLAKNFSVYSETLPIGERINYFNLRNNYFSSKNKIKVSFANDLNKFTYHYDNVIVVLSDVLIETGELLSFVNSSVSKDTNFRSSKINIVHNGTTPYLTEYAIIDIGSIPVTFSTTIQGSNVLLNAAVSNANISDTVEIKVATNVLVDV
jgi:hypothetical protein